MDFLSDDGHILIYGETSSGKTTLSKKICEYLNVNQIYVYTTVNKCYSDMKNIKIFNDFNNIKEIKNDIISLIDNNADNKFIIVFDDFNHQINTSTNPEYNELFTKFRHYNTRIICLSHTIKAVGRTVRQNCRYIFISAIINNNETIKDLSIQYYNSNHRELENILKKAREYINYNYIFIDKRLNTAEIMNANDIKIIEYDKIIPVNINTAIAAIHTPETVNYMGTGTGLDNKNETNFSKKSQRDFLDNSKNNITVNNTISSSQLIQNKKDQYDIKIMTIKMENELKMEEKKEKIKCILLNPNRTSMDVTYIINTLPLFAKIPIEVTKDNYLEYGELFLLKHYDIETKLFSNNITKLDNVLNCITTISSSGDTITDMIKTIYNNIKI